MGFEKKQFPGKWDQAPPPPSPFTTLFEQPGTEVLYITFVLKENIVSVQKVEHIIRYHKL